MERSGAQWWFWPFCAAGQAFQSYPRDPKKPPHFKNREEGKQWAKPLVVDQQQPQPAPFPTARLLLAVGEAEACQWWQQASLLGRRLPSEEVAMSFPRASHASARIRAFCCHLLVGSQPLGSHVRSEQGRTASYMEGKALGVAVISHRMPMSL